MILGLSEEELLEFGHNACAGCGEALAARFVMKAAGKDTIVVNATGCLEVFSTPYPQTAWKVPWIHGAFENVAAIASGVDIALEKLGKRKKVNVLAFGGDGGTFDIGFQALSGMAERGHNVCYVCYDNEAYMNCLSLDSLIMTEKGLKKITEVKKGEMVYAFDQKKYQLVLKKCTGVFDNGRKRIFEMETFHHNIKATGNHPFLVLKHNGRGKENSFVWKTLDKIKKGDEVVTLKKIDKGCSYVFKKIKMTKKGDYKVNKLNCVKFPVKSTPELMKYLGIYVGDGWIKKERGEIGFAVPKNNCARKKLLELQKKIFKLNAKTDDNYVHVNSVNIAKFIDSLGFGKGAKNKTIPSWVFTLTEKEKIAFVDGLMLADGYKKGKSWRYVSASDELLSRLRLLLQTMNYRVGKIHHRVKKKGTHCVYRKLLKDSSYGYVCFSKKNKPKISKYKNQYKYVNFLVDNPNFDIEKVKKVTKQGVEPTLDLRIDGEHNFIANGVVVHNTGIQRSGATPKYAATTTSPAGKKIPGKTEYAKPMPFIMAAHGIYVATASIAYPQDLTRKVKKALSIDGPSYIQIFNSCPLGWKHKFNLSVKVAELAYKTNVFPLYEIENGVVTISKKPIQKMPVSEYFKLQGRFKHLGEKEIKEIQEKVDSKWENLLKLEETKISF